MTGRRLVATVAVAALASGAGTLAAQGYRLRLDTRWQAAAYRGVSLDSIPAEDTVSTPGQGPTSPEGYAVWCREGAPYCSFFRPGPDRRGGPVSTMADLTMWGLGLRGVSVRVAARLGLDLGTADVWPGTEPQAELLEAYAEYAATRATARAGRQVVASRLGTMGFDGAAVTLRERRWGVEIQGYVGSALARGAAIPVTSPALNPLDDFQPRRRQIVAGAGAGWTSSRVDLRADYQREVDQRSDYFVSERVGVDAALRPLDGVLLTGGADYDMAQGWWGSAEASVGYSTRRLRATLGARRYRPHFDLWTIWGAFSPVPYRSVQAGLAVAADTGWEVRGRYEAYEFGAAEANTPLFDAAENGWRWEVGTTVTRTPWTLDLGYRREFGPGAALAGLAGTLTYRPTPRVTLRAHAASLDRPLEFRFNDAVVHAYGLDAEIQPRERVRVTLTAQGYDERHRRPDAAAFEWDQVRVSARVVLLLARGADDRGLPAAIRMLPGGRSAR